jgi:hypothetical protein
MVAKAKKVLERMGNMEKAEKVVDIEKQVDDAGDDAVVARLISEKRMKRTPTDIENEAQMKRAFLTNNVDYDKPRLIKIPDMPNVKKSVEITFQGSKKVLDVGADFEAEHVLLLEKMANEMPELFYPSKIRPFSKIEPVHIPMKDDFEKHLTIKQRFNRKLSEQQQRDMLYSLKELLDSGQVVEVMEPVENLISAFLAPRSARFDDICGVKCPMRRIVYD